MRQFGGRLTGARGEKKGGFEDLDLYVRARKTFDPLVGKGGAFKRRGRRLNTEPPLPHPTASSSHFLFAKGKDIRCLDMRKKK